MKCLEITVTILAVFFLILTEVRENAHLESDHNQRKAFANTGSR